MINDTIIGNSGRMVKKTAASEPTSAAAIPPMVQSKTFKAAGTGVQAIRQQSSKERQFEFSKRNTMKVRGTGGSGSGQGSNVGSQLSNIQIFPNLSLKNLDLEFNPKNTASTIGGPHGNVTVIQQKPQGSYQKQRTMGSATKKPVTGIVISGHNAIDKSKGPNGGITGLQITSNPTSPNG